MNKRYALVILSLLLSFSLTAGKIEKGFQSLDIYNYFDAKRLFEKALKRDNVAASYGLSIIYLRNDNPFFNLDSAHSCIVRATSNYSNVKPKKKIKYSNWGADSLGMFEHRDKVSSALFEYAKLNHTVAIYQRFLDRNPWSSHKDSVVYYRDELAFEIASKKNTAAAYQTFLQTYPQSERTGDAQSAFDRLNYQERTAGNKFIDYIAFVKDFPKSPYRADAEDQIYAIATKTGSLEAYKNFIDDHPNNRNVPTAWKKMFSTHLQQDYSTSSIQAFLNEFEDYPFKEELMVQLNSVERVLFPIKVRNKWGYIDETKEFYIAPKYEVAEAFHEGLAIVQLEGKYGFVNKSGDLVIDAIYNDAYKMSEGHAVVEVDDKWGLINRSGEFVINPSYDDLGNLNEGLCYFSDGDLYGYFDLKGIIRLKQQYSDADDFDQGKAIVSKNGNYGLIDVFGTTTIPFKYNKLKQHYPNVYLAKFEGNWGLISDKEDTIVAFEYDFIGPMKNNRAIVEKEGLFNYIDPKGNLILTDWLVTYPEYRQLAVFQNSYAKIKYEKGYNLIDTTGKKLFGIDQLSLGDYGTYIAIKRGDKWGYLNKNGRLVIGYNFTAAKSFQGKFAQAGGAPLVGLINRQGEYVVGPYFERLEQFNDTVLIAKSRGKYGLLGTNGDTLLNFAYISVEPFTAEVVQIETSEEIYYYDLKRNQFIRKEGD
jgi:outer membrane protein assembly factor BamD (BamD/ComL family)